MATILGLALKISADATGIEQKLTPVERALRQLDAEAAKVTSVFDKFAGSSAAAAQAQEAAKQSFSDLAGQLRRNQISVSQFTEEFGRLGVAVKAEADEFAKAAAITESVATPAEKFKEKVAELDAQLKAGRITSETYARAVSDIEKKFGGLDRTLTVVDERTGKIASVFGNIGDSVSAVSGATEGVGNAVKAVSDAGVAVIDLGYKIAGATAAFKAFRLVTENYNVPQGILGIVLNLGKFITVVKVAEVVAGQFGADLSGVADAATKASLAFAAFKVGSLVGLDKAIAPAVQTIGTALPIALARVGVPIAATNATIGLLSAGMTRFLTFSIPGVGQLAATAYVVAKAFSASRDTADELAASVAETTREAQRLGDTFQNLQLQKLLDAGRTRDEVAQLGLALNGIDARQLDDLAFANERAAKASQDSQLAIGAVSQTIAKTFTGAFASLTNGIASVTEGFTDLVAGINAIADPIASVIRPFFTLIGTGVEAVLQLVGAFGSIVGVILRFAGVLAKVALSPVIVGFNRFADTIRAGVGQAFTWFSDQIDKVQVKITQLQEFFAGLPIIGAAFASSQGGVLAAASDGAVKVEESTKAAAAAQEELNRAFENSRTALDGVIAKSAEFGQAGFDAAYQFQQALADLQEQADAKELNADQYARGVANATAEYDRQIESLKRVQEETKRAADEAQKRVDADRQVTEQLLEQARIDRDFGGDNARFKASESVLAVEREIARVRAEVITARNGGDYQAVENGKERLRQLENINAIQRSIADGSAKAAEDERKRLDDQRNRVTELLAAGQEQSQVEKDIIAVQEQQAFAQKALNDARRAGNQEEATAAATRLAALDGLETKLIGQRDAIDQGFADGFTAAFDKVDEAIGTATDKATEFGDAGAGAARRLEEGIAAAKAQAKGGILDKEAFDAEVRRQQEFFDNELKGIEEAAQARLKNEELVNGLINAQRFDGDNARVKAAENLLAIEQEIKLAQEAVAKARADGDREAVAASVRRLADLDQVRAKERDVASGAAQQREEYEKAYQKQVDEATKQRQDQQQQIQQEQQRIAEEERKAAEAEAKRQEERLEKLNTLGERTIKAADVRTTEGASLVVSLAAAAQDPALIQQRLQTKLLERMNENLAQAAANYFNSPVAIVGYSSYGSR